MPDVRLLVLHGLRIKGFAEAASVAALYGLDETDVSVELKAAADEGLVARRDGRISGWSLTGGGRAAAAALLADELERAGARPAIEGAYERFAAVNGELLDVCTAWQLKAAEGGPSINDHRDAGYDESVVGRLAAVHATAEPVVADLAAALPRFGRYRERLANALARVQRGEMEWFTKPVLDSYHTVWFELHEDLLSTLGLARGAESR